LSPIQTFIQYSKEAEELNEKCAVQRPAKRG